MIQRQVARENTLSSERKSNEPDQTGSKATRQSKERSKVGVVDSLPAPQESVDSGIKYAGGYAAFKRCLIDAWPNGRVEYCAHMVMIDVKFPIHLLDQTWCIFRDCFAFISHLRMPSPIMTGIVSTYIAKHYQKTSAALFDGKSKEVCLQIFLSEKGAKHVPRKRSGSAFEAREEYKKSNAYVTIKMRSLSKKHDWNTVK